MEWICSSPTCDGAEFDNDSTPRACPKCGAWMNCFFDEADDYRRAEWEDRHPEARQEVLEE